MQEPDPKDWKFHPDRENLIAEAHARPAQAVTAPSQVLHLAFRCSKDIRTAFIKAVSPEHSDRTIRHIVREINGVRIKLELHTEFMSCSFFQDLSDPDVTIDLLEFLNGKFPISETEILVLIRLDVVKSSSQMIKLLAGTDRLYGGKIRNDIDVRSTFKPDENGIINFVIQAEKLTSDELGRRIQRLIEMETYRTMSLLGLPKAREVGGRLTAYEQELDDLTVSLRESKDSTQKDDEHLFNRLSSLSERNNILASQIRYRFAASRAYFDLFQQRTT
ncbi:MAG: DUF3422 family protein, partial [Pseudomonadota bacterium]